ncbi:MAG TPA: hypothetical protein VGR95_01085 [Thermoanaerobaculia bacterium]|nr:hypothetical protein [Thermoanaerobaculia bacterium]
MSTPAAAIAWEFRTRHRWGLIAIAAYLVVLAVCRVRLSAAPEYHSVDTFAFFVVVPLTATFIYFLAVFSYGHGGDLAGRQSIFPPRMFTLPVSDTALAGWPMLFGTIVMALLWLATRVLALWPKGAEVPTVWPALLAASLLAWTQALTWMPYPLPGMRVILTILWLASIDAIVLVALHYRAHEWMMLGILAPNLPLAFFVARYAVGRARRGGASSVLGPQSSVLRSEDRGPRTEDFRSPARAQFWFEWRMYGRTLPALVAVLLPFELAMLWIYAEVPPLVYEMLGGILLTPPFMAAFVAPAASAAMTPFIARRPVSGGSLIAAKLKAAAASTAVAWQMVLIATPLALHFSGTMHIAMAPVDLLIDVFGAPRAIVLLLLAFLGLIASTWKQLVQSLCIGMSGRPWLVKGSVFATLCAITMLGLGFGWIVTDAHRFSVAWNAIPMVVAAAAVVKVIAAIFVISRLRTPNQLLIGVIGWNVVVFALFAILNWSVPGLLLSSGFLLFLSILEVPLVRLAAIGMWNRCG